MKFKQMGKDDWSLLHALSGRFLDGLCYIFAIALSRGTGWPIVGLIEKEELCHVALQQEGGMFWDHRGSFLEKEFGKPFGVSPPYKLVSVAEQELVDILKSAGKSDESISYSAKLIWTMAQALWPDLPRGPSDFGSRVIVFGKELEQLSRKYGIWLYGNLPTNPPLLGEQVGDEIGYQIQPVMSGSAYSIRRLLKI